MVKIIGHTVNKEVAVMCSDKFASILRSKPIENFEFGAVIRELESQALILLSLLKNCLKTRTPMPNCSVIITMIVALICKHRNPSCSLLQRMISLILYAGHSSKQVSNSCKSC